ncbi:histidine kinase [Acidobacteriia bacterium AH_259_A11_L15]|nr:histidine kinase [Acidobacteriia bacterium AH_259_A11_L15]
MEQPLLLQDLVLTLLFRLGVAASIAALIARSIFFQRVLRREERSVDERLLFVLLYAPPVAVGVLTRILLGYRATDVSLEGALVAGLAGGRMTGMMVGTLAALPAFLNGELLSLPFGMLCGAVGGVLRELCANKERVWQFGPFSFLSLPRWLYDLVTKREGNWLMLPLLGCAGLELLRIGLGQTFPGALFYLGAGEGWLVVLPIFATIVAVGLSLMIWNNTRIQIKLLDQEQSLLAARMEALTSQINPHFLFNTLNTVASLVRVEPDAARKLVVKLSAILRRLLGKHDNFVPLRQELEFIDDYLAIEMVRFGPEKLQFYKQVEEEALELFVPSMLLQPIIENSIRHGLGPRIEGGEIRLRAVRQDGRLLIEVEDNGVGIAEERIPEIYGSGIGISNVNERLKVLYGKEYSLRIESLPNLGTTIRIEIPEVSSS